MCCASSSKSRSGFSLLRICLLVISLVLLPSICSAAIRGGLNVTGMINPGSPDSGNSGSAAASAPASPSYVYVGSYKEGSSKGKLDMHITGFAVASDGSAQQVPGSPFQGPSFDLVGNPKFLFGDDGHNIVTYTRRADGSIQQTSSVNGTAYDICRHEQGYKCDGGPGGLSLDLSGQTLYVFEWFFDGSNNAYLNWSIAPDGSLSYVANPSQDPIYATAGGWPLSFSPDDRYAYTTSVCKWDGSVWGFVRNAGDGRLGRVNPGAEPPPELFPNGSVGCVNNLAVSATGYAAIEFTGGYCCNWDGSLLGTYRINPDGTLALIPGSGLMLYENSMAFDPSGKYLAMLQMVQTGQKSYQSFIQMYELLPDGKLAMVGAPQQLPPPGLLSFSSLAWDNANHLYALATQCNRSGYYDCTSALYIFNSNAGILTPASVQPVGQATSLAVVPGS